MSGKEPNNPMRFVVLSLVIAVMVILFYEGRVTGGGAVILTFASYMLLDLID